jgi:uncharacterized protein (TIGR00661 family)
MRLLYGVHGYGRGHATRALGVLPHLASLHEIMVLAGGDAYDAIGLDFPVVRIPTFGFAYNRGPGARQRSNWQTLRRNLPGLLDVKFGGPTFQMVCGLVEDYGPDVVIADAESWTHHAAAALNIPRISFDHIGILAHCRPRIEWRDRIEAAFDAWIYRRLMGHPDRIIVSSFYTAPPRSPEVQVVGTLPRQPVRELAPTRGNYLLAYFNKGNEQITPQLLDALDSVGCPIHLYGCSRRGRRGNISFLAPSGLPFLEDLAGCRGVVSTAGNQLVGEAIFLGKPMLVMPEHCVEQRLNAAAVRRLGIGMRVSLNKINARRLRSFLDRADEFAANTRRHARDGLPEALASIERFLRELVPQRGQSLQANETRFSVSSGREVRT